jgi:thiamine pyrophosphokinase
MTNQQAIIVTGGVLGDWVLPYIENENVLIGCDKGAFFLVHQGYNPYVSLGDFDSVSSVELEQIHNRSQIVIGYDSVNKDLTDTEIALDWAISNHFKEILILGATGTRIDHTLANIHLLTKCLMKNVSCKIIDAHNEIILINQFTKIRKGNYSHISLIPISKFVNGITLQGFQYPLTQATLKISQTLGISNILINEEGSIDLIEGELLVIQSKD